MLVYSYGEAMNYMPIIFGLSLLAFGLFAFFFLGKFPMRVKESFSTRFSVNTRFNLIENAKLSPNIFKMMGFLAILVSSFFLIAEIRDLIYRNNVRYFENTKSLSARIHNIQKVDNFGNSFVTIDTDNHRFYLLNECFVDDAKLSLSDSIEIEYFEKQMDNESERIFEVLSIKILL